VMTEVRALTFPFLSFPFVTVNNDNDAHSRTLPLPLGATRGPFSFPHVHVRVPGEREPETVDTWMDVFVRCLGGRWVSCVDDVSSPRMRPDGWKGGVGGWALDVYVVGNLGIDIFRKTRDVDVHLQELLVDGEFKLFPRAKQTQIVDRRRREVCRHSSTTINDYTLTNFCLHFLFLPSFFSRKSRHCYRITPSRRPCSQLVPMNYGQARFFELNSSFMAMDRVAIVQSLDSLPSQSRTLFGLDSPARTAKAT